MARTYESGASELPRKVYTPKNRFVLGSKLSEHELARLVWLWCAGNTFSDIERQFATPGRIYDWSFNALNDTLCSKGLDPIERLSLEPLSRQSAKSYAARISDHLFWDIFSYDQTIEDGIAQSISEVESFLRMGRPSRLALLVGRFISTRRLRESVMVKRMGEQVLNSVGDSSSIDPQLFYRAFLVFRYWIAISDRQNYGFQSKHAIKQAEKSLDRSVYKFGRSLYRRSNSVQLADALPMAFLLGLQGFLLRQASEAVLEENSADLSLKMMDDKFFRAPKEFRLFSAAGGSDLILRLLAHRPLVFR